MNKYLQELNKCLGYSGETNQRVHDIFSHHHVTRTFNNMLKLYELIQEYEYLSKDKENCKNDCTQKLINNKLEELERTIRHDYIVIDLRKDEI